MIGVGIAFVAAVHLWIAGCSLCALRVTHRLEYIPVLLITIALTYDNSVLALGSIFGEGAVLKQLSEPRYAMHALLTPLLIVWAVLVSSRLALPWTRRRGAVVAAVTLAIGLVCLGVWTNIFRLSLGFENTDGLSRYVSISSWTRVGALSPIASGVFVFVIGLTLWGRYHFRALALGAGAMALVAGIPAAPPLLGQAAEAVLMLSVVVTNRWLPRAEHAAVSRRDIARVGRRLGWLAVPLLLFATVVQYVPIDGATIPDGQRAVGMILQSVYQVALVGHGFSAHAVYGYPPRSRNRLRRVHMHLGMVNVPLLIAGMIFYMLNIRVGGDLVTVLLFATIAAHTALGATFAFTRHRNSSRIGPGTRSAAKSRS